MCFDFRRADRITGRRLLHVRRAAPGPFLSTRQLQHVVAAGFSPRAMSSAHTPEPPLPPGALLPLVALLTAVTGILARIIATGADPFAADLPVNGFPDVAIQPFGAAEFSETNS